MREEKNYVGRVWQQLTHSLSSRMNSKSLIGFGISFVTIVRIYEPTCFTKALEGFVGLGFINFINFWGLDLLITGFKLDECVLVYLTQMWVLSHCYAFALKDLLYQVQQSFVIVTLLLASPIKIWLLSMEKVFQVFCYFPTSLKTSVNIGHTCF